MPLALKKVFAALFILCAACSGALWFAPATWLDLVASTATSGQLRVVQAQGRLWNGSGVIAVDLGGLKPLTRELHFSLRPSLIPLGFSMQISGQGLQWSDQPSEIQYRNGSLKIPAGQLEGLIIDSTGSPTLLGLAQVSGQINLQWPTVIWSQQGVSGQGQVSAEFRNIASALAPIRPLANLRAELSIANPESRPWNVSSTADSVIMLSARGDLKEKTAEGSLRCQRFCDYVRGALLLLGKPSGEDYVFSF